MVSAILVARDAYDRYAAATHKESFDGKFDVYSVLSTLCAAIALYNTVELKLLMFTTFKKWRGLYFWSLFICNVGIICYTLGEVLLFFKLGSTGFNLAFNDIGWILMVTFQSLVLYSRLGLMLDNNTILASVKWMILLDSAVLCTIVIVLQIGSLYSTQMGFARGYYYIEQIQLVWFTVQEIIISGLYIWRTLALLKLTLKEKTRSMVWQLFTINVFIIMMDVTLVVLEFLHYQLFQEFIKAFVYSVKLKLELNILTKLIDFVEGGKRQRSMTLDNIEVSTINGQAAADVRRENGESIGSKSTRSDSGDANLMKGTIAWDSQESALHQKVSNVAPSHVDMSDMTRTFSHNSTYNARTTGRETDMMYADMLRDMK